MDKSVLSFEHEAWYHDLGSGGTYSGSLPPATQDSFTNFSDFGISEDQNYNPSHHFACQTVDPAFDDATNKIKTYPHLPFTGPSYVDTAYEHDQLSSQPQSGPQPVSMHYNQKPAKNDTYTKSSGVYSPEELSPTRNDRSTNSPYHCPRCDKGFTTRIIVKNHFPHCISMHGNPDQLRWDDHITLKPLRKEETGDEARSYQFHKGKITDKARTDKFRDSLTAYSGVVIPSRLPPGQSPVKFVSSKRQGSHLCAVCSGGPFSYIYHVKSHFNNCVRKNGNPRGANWYDRLDSKHKKRYLPGRFDAPRTMSVLLKRNSRPWLTSYC